MYCPKCGQQAQESVRFCSRCGFQMGAVSQLIATEGMNFPQTSETQRKELSERRKGIRRGAKILFFSLVMFPFALALSFAVDSPEPIVLPFTVFLAGCFWMLYYRLFGDDLPVPTEQHLPSQMSSVPVRPVLPAHYENAVSGYHAPARNTADMMEQPSVTETTTKLLDDN